MVASLSYYRPGAVYPRDRLRQPYPEVARENARRRAELIADLESPTPVPPSASLLCGRPGAVPRLRGTPAARPRLSGAPGVEEC